MNNEIIILLALVLLSAFFSAVEIAFFSLSEPKLRSLADKPGRLGQQAQLVLKIKQRPQRLLTTLIAGDNLADVAATAIATSLAIQWFGSLGVGLATAVMTIMTLVVGKVIPKALAQQHAEGLARWTGPIIYIVVYALTPITIVFDVMVRGIYRLTGTAGRQGVSKDEVKAMIFMGAEAGVVAMEEHEMIENVFSLDEVTVENIMTHINDVVSLNLAQPDEDLVRIMSDTGFSRFPVYSGNIDNIQGIVYSKDIMEELVSNGGKADRIDVKKLMQRVVFVPEEKNVLSLLRDFQKQHKHIAVVVNEFGETRGVVTLEDVLEEIVGDIADEQDTTQGRIKRINTKTIIVDADVTVEEIDNAIDARVYPDDHKTIAWVILKELERVPAKGDEVTLPQAKAIIEEAEEQKIKRVKLIKMR